MEVSDGLHSSNYISKKLEMGKEIGDKQQQFLIVRINPVWETNKASTSTYNTREKKKAIGGGEGKAEIYLCVWKPYEENKNQVNRDYWMSTWEQI